jgi:hypothetical protein
MKEGTRHLLEKAVPSSIAGSSMPSMSASKRTMTRKLLVSSEQVEGMLEHARTFLAAAREFLSKEARTELTS